MTEKGRCIAPRRWIRLLLQVKKVTDNRAFGSRTTRTCQAEAIAPKDQGHEEDRQDHRAGTSRHRAGVADADRSAGRNSNARRSRTPTGAPLDGQPATGVAAPASTTRPVAPSVAHRPTAVATRRSMTRSVATPGGFDLAATAPRRSITRADATSAASRRNGNGRDGDDRP